MFKLKNKEERIQERLHKFRKMREDETRWTELSDLAFLRKKEKTVQAWSLITMLLGGPIYRESNMSYFLCFFALYGVLNYARFRNSSVIRFMASHNSENFDLSPTPSRITEDTAKQSKRKWYKLHRMHQKAPFDFNKPLFQFLSEQENWINSHLVPMVYLNIGRALMENVPYWSVWRYALLILFIVGMSSILWQYYRMSTCIDYMIKHAAFDAEGLPFLEEESKN